MALRSPALWMGNPAVNHTAQNDRLFRSGLLRPETVSTASNRPLTATSGVLVGPPGTMGEVTLLSNTQFTVNPARWVIFGTASALAGTYEVTNDAVETLAITAQDATQFRRSYFGVWVIDSFVAGSGDDLPHRGLVDGVLAASAAAAALPSAGVLPANFLALGEFLIPPVGQAVTYTPYDLRTGLRGSILPVTSTDTRNGAFVGQTRYHPTNGLEVWDGNRWASPNPLGQWIDDVYSTSYGFALAGYQNPPSMGGRQVTVPPGRMFELELEVGQLNVGPGANASFELYINSIRQDGCSVFNPAASGTMTLNMRLRGRWTNTGNASADVPYSITSVVSPGAGSMNAGSYGVVSLRHRIA